MRPVASVAIPTERPKTLTPRGTNPAYHRLPVLERYERDSESGCWVWAGYKDATGYGRCKVDGHSSVMAHHVGPIPEGLAGFQIRRSPMAARVRGLTPYSAQSAEAR